MFCRAGAQLLLAVSAVLFPGLGRAAQESSAHAEALRALRRAVSFYRQKVGYQGAYLYKYSADLSKQEGEGRAHGTTGWTQPPGGPAVGEAYLEAWRLTGESCCLAAAREVADALVKTQLRSGGWYSRIELDPTHRRKYAYRYDTDRKGRANVTTFDDNKSQSALKLLMHVDEATGFADSEINDAVNYALERMLAAQYPNGAWPQRYSAPPDAEKCPVVPASYPETWPREFPAKDYRGYYTLNDNNMSDVIVMLFEAYRIYGREDCLTAAGRTGNFFLLARMPDPQPGWAQQYNLRMHPAWARKFEPPAITGGESQRVMRSLLDLYRRTADRRYLDAVGPSLEYYKSCVLPGGKLARFYELRTNRPLYFTKDYRLTYSPDDVPTHYAFTVKSKLGAIEREYQKLRKITPAEMAEKGKEAGSRGVPRMTPARVRAARRAIDAMDERGAWVEDGKLDYHGDDDTSRIISSKTFIRNLIAIAEFIAAVES